FVFVLFFIVALIIYYPALNGEFFFDDEHIILRNKYITDFKYLPDLFKNSVLASIGFNDNFYRPLSFVVYLCINQIFGFQPQPNPLYYHLVSIITHFLCSIVMFRIMINVKTGRLAALIGSMVFLVHPVQTEAIAVACGLADPLSLLFILCSLYYCIKYYESNKFRYLFLIIICSVLSILAKERGAMIFCLLPVFDIVFLKKQELKWKQYFLDKQRIQIWCCLFFFLIIYIILRVTALNFNNTLDFYDKPNIYSENLSVRIYTFFYVFLFYYLKLLFYPYPLYMEKSVTVFTDFMKVQVICGVIVFTIMLILSYKSFFKRKLLFFCIVWFLFALAPTSGIIPVNDIVMEHWLYFSMVSVAMTAGIFAASVLNPDSGIFENKKKILVFLNNKFIKHLNYFIVLLFIVSFSYISFKQNYVWKNAYSFFTHILKFNPNSVKAHNNLAMVLSDEKMFDEAEFHYKKSIELDNSFPQPHHNLARIYLMKNKINEAILEYENALKINPDFVFSHQDLLAIYNHIGNVQKIEYHKNRIKQILPQEVQ
ncbi:tetratricopeptide repeat protein, partial [Candidatus Dependentiae bacterium]|nr:tetratricopeptide repeat protein [Candidatus Dependentiae bacterium]